MGGLLPHVAMILSWGSPKRPFEPPPSVHVPVRGTSTGCYGRIAAHYNYWPETYRLGRKARRGRPARNTAKWWHRNGGKKGRAWNGGLTLKQARGSWYGAPRWYSLRNGVEYGSLTGRAEDITRLERRGARYVPTQTTTASNFELPLGGTANTAINVRITNSETNPWR